VLEIRKGDVGDVLLERAADAALKLLDYCRSNEWAGYDPYDALNSRLIASVPILSSRVPRIVLTQVLKRSPVNIRPLALVPKTQNPKALGLFLSAVLKLARAGVVEADGLATSIVDQLAALRSPRADYWCWGYSFPWQTRGPFVPRHSPNLVCTTFAADALIDAYEQTGDTRCLTMAASAAHYILNELVWTNGADVVSLCYPLASQRTQVHNANLLGAALLCRVSAHTGERQLRETALAIARYSADAQRADGSWPYGESPAQGWIDNFHTGFNLMALRGLQTYARTDEFEGSIARGFAFYLGHFFRSDGAPKYFHDRQYPIDVHCVAQALITLVALRDRSVNSSPMMRNVLTWALDHMWDERGFFYYRVLRLGTIRTSYMRWSQAWMLQALSTVFIELDAATETPVPDERPALVRAHR
jgi:hypothetical protein